MAAREEDEEPPAHVYGCLRTQGVIYELEEQETTIGRGDECDLVLEGHGISRLHARLAFPPRGAAGGAAAQLTDAGSSNGTFVNSVRLTPHQPHDLHHGDSLRFSAHEKALYVLEIPGGGHQAAPAPRPPEGRADPPADRAADRAAGLPRPQPSRAPVVLQGPPSENVAAAKHDQQAARQQQAQQRRRPQPQPQPQPQQPQAEPPQPGRATARGAPSPPPSPASRVRGAPSERQEAPRPEGAPKPAPAERRSQRPVQPRRPEAQRPPELAAPAAAPGVVPLGAAMAPAPALPAHAAAPPQWPPAAYPQHAPGEPAAHARAGLEPRRPWQPQERAPPREPQQLPPPSWPQLGAGAARDPAAELEARLGRLEERLGQDAGRTLAGQEPPAGCGEGAGTAAGDVPMDATRPLPARRASPSRARPDSAAAAAGPGAAAQRPDPPSAASRAGDSGGAGAAEVQALAVGALALQRAAGRISAVEAGLRRLPRTSASAGRAVGEEDEEDGGAPDEADGGAVGPAEQLCRAGERLERAAARCRARVAELRPLAAEERPARGGPAGAAADGAGEARELSRRRELLLLELRALQAEGEQARGALVALRGEGATLAEAELAPPAPQDSGQVEALDEAARELERLLGLYRCVAGPPSSEEAPQPPPRPAPAAGPPDDLSATASSLASLTPGPTGLPGAGGDGAEGDLGRASPVLAAVLSLQATLERLERGGQARRKWLALDFELQRLRDEDERQRERLQGLRRESSEVVRSAERSLEALQSQAGLALGQAAAEPPQQAPAEAEPPGAAGEAGGGGGASSVAARCAALLLRQLDELEAERPALDAQLSAAAAAAARERHRRDAAAARADLAGKMRADAEDAADAGRERRHRGAARRLEALGRANAALRAQLRRAREREARLCEGRPPPTGAAGAA